MLSLAIALIASAPVVVCAQPSPRRLGPTIAEAAGIIGVNGTIRQLPDGRVFVNDAAHRQVVALDSLLQHPVVIMDSVAGRPNSYGPAILSALRPYGRDTTLFLDVNSGSVLLLDEGGWPGRVVSIGVDAMNAMLGLGTDRAGIDAAGRLIHGRVINDPRQRDAAVLLGLNLRTRAVDTVTLLAHPAAGVRPTPKAPAPPLLFTSPDAWAVTSDGRIAVVRGSDYHVDFISPAGERLSGSRIPSDRHRLSDDEKSVIADSATHVRDSVTRCVSARMPAGARPTTNAFGGVVSFTVPAVARDSSQQIRYASGVTIPAPIPSSARACPPIPAGAPPIVLAPPISIESVPDYRPLFTVGDVYADGDGGLWVRRRSLVRPRGGEVFDVIDARGALIDRIELEPGHTLVGFGAGGFVYQRYTDAGRTILRKSRFR